MKIVGLFMVKNEDIYIEQAVRNVVEFCDVIYVDDNGSTDRTMEILQSLAVEFAHIQVRTITDTIESNDNLIQYFGTDTWVFAVDGDEIYDKKRLVEMRKRILAGDFDQWWLILGNCIHVTQIQEDRSLATGYIAPPCSSMTKLYNFSLIDDFPISDERLHGTPVFKDGGDAPSKWYRYCDEQSWEESIFRCVHTAFVERTSKPESQKRFMGARLNPPEIYAIKKIWRDHSFFYALPRVIKSLVTMSLGAGSRVKRYKRGRKTTKNVAEFFEAS